MALNAYADEIFKMRRNGRSIESIARVYGVTANAISCALKRWGEPPVLPDWHRKAIGKSVKKYWARVHNGT